MVSKDALNLDKSTAKVIRLRKDKLQKKNTKDAKKKVSFGAIAIDTKSLDFDREEANER